jgi:hypothetical protein
MAMSKILYTLVRGPLDFEALGFNLPSLWVNPALTHSLRDFALFVYICIAVRDPVIKMGLGSRLPV